MVDRLIISLDIRGDHTATGMEFKPEMLGPSFSQLKTVFFNPAVKLTKELLSKAELPLDPRTFMAASDYTTLMKYAGRSVRQNKKLSVTRAKEAGVIDHNAEFVTKLLFPARGRFYINGRAYIIGTAKIEKTASGALFTESKQPISALGSGASSKGTDYKITVKLSLLEASKKPSSIDFSRLKCDAKARVIEKQAKELFDATWDLYRRATPSSRMAPVMYTSSTTGVATGLHPTKVRYPTPVSSAVGAFGAIPQARAIATGPAQTAFHNLGATQGHASVPLLSKSSIPAAPGRDTRSAPTTYKFGGRKKRTRRHRKGGRRKTRRR